MSLDFYYLSLSSPCRAVMLTAEALGITLNYNTLNVMAGEHLTPEYEQMNPQKNIPFLVDDDYKLSESRAIMCYLADQYGDNSPLYPSGHKQRALVHQLLHFDAGTLYKSVAGYYFPVVFKGETEYNEANYEKLKDAFQVLDKLLEDNEWAAGSDMTIADLALIATVSTAEVLGFDYADYANVSDWAERVKASAPGYDGANAEGLEMMKSFKTDVGED